MRSISVQDLQRNADARLYAINGKVLGIPQTAGYEYVYYWKDMFTEAGVEVPDTWEELKTVSKKLQEHFGANDPDFMAIALGAKDEWPDYPYMEFMPALVNGNGQNWNDMAKTDTPFAGGSDINTAYHRVYDLFTSGVLGKDPLGLGNDQATNLFAQKKAAIIALGDWVCRIFRTRLTAQISLARSICPSARPKASRSATWYRVTALWASPLTARTPSLQRRLLSGITVMRGIPDISATFPARPL